MWLFNRFSDSFAAPIGQRTSITEVSVVKKAEEPEKLEGRVVCEVVVECGMQCDRTRMLCRFLSISNRYAKWCWEDAWWMFDVSDRHVSSPHSRKSILS